MIAGILFTLCIVAAVGVFFYQLWRRFQVLWCAVPDVSRFDHIPERVRAVLVWAFGQRKFVRRNPGAERSAGWMHFCIFWGFFILGIQIITMFGRIYSDSFVVPGFSLNLLGGPYMLLRDITEVAVLFWVGVALVRWGITHAPRLYGFLPPEKRQREKSHWEAYVILLFIAIIMVAGLVYDGGRIVVHPNNRQIVRDARWEPFSTLVSLGLAKVGPSFASHASYVALWVNGLVVLVFLDLLPPSKHFHIITAIPNIFFLKLEPKGRLSKQDLENDSRFGTSHIDHFTWKQVLDMFSCTECGRCSSHCPATASKKNLAPRQFLLDLRDYLYGHQDEMIEKRSRPGDGDGTEPSEVGENIVGPVIHDDTVWACTTCRACEEACPPMIEYVDMRRHLVQEEARFPKELTRTFKNMETQSNPWGLDSQQRFEWAEQMNVPTLADKPDAEFLYYVGCAGSFDDRNKKTTQTFARVLQKAGVDFACLAREELCNGETARRLGNEYLYQTMAQMLIETLNNYKVRKIIVNCPHCFNTIKNEFPQFGGSYEIIHAADLVQQLTASGRLKISPEFSKRTVYHDSCYYGRYNDVFDEPRMVLSRAGAQVHEMQRHHKFGMCCGAGGGRMWLEEDPDKRVNLLRTEQALQTDPEVIAVSCPYCNPSYGLTIVKGNEIEVSQ
jgi:Fe-S oxidoreductase